MLDGPCSFIASTHTYRIGPWEVPGITTVLRAAGHNESTWIPDSARERGHVIHEAIEALEVGHLEFETWDSPYRGWLAGFLRYKRERRPRHDAVELGAFERAYGFATHVDLVGALDGPMAMNVKSGAYMESHGIQTAGEVIALDGRRSNRRRYGLYLKPNGRYELEEFTDPADFDQFFDALQQWRDGCHREEKHGPLSLLKPVPLRSRG